MGWSTALSAHSKSQRKLGPGGKVDLLLSTRTAGKPILWMAGQPALVTAVSLISSRWRWGDFSDAGDCVRTAGQLLFPGSERGRAVLLSLLSSFQSLPSSKPSFQNECLLLGSQNGLPGGEVSAEDVLGLTLIPSSPG